MRNRIKRLHPTSSSSVFVQPLHPTSSSNLFIQRLHPTSSSSVFIQPLHPASLGRTRTIGEKHRTRMMGFRGVSFLFMFFTFFLLVFLPAGADGRFLSLLVRNGDNVTLPCPNATAPQVCPRAAWTFNRTSGGSGGSGGPVTESFRVSVSPSNCTLRLTEVEGQDAGVYVCSAAGNQPEGGGVKLSVVKLVECRSELFVGLECQLTGPSNQAVRWSGVPEEDGVEQSTSSGFASVSFAASHRAFVSRAYLTWRCAVDGHTFSLPAPPPGEEPGFSSLDVVMVTMHVVEVVLIAAVIVLLIRASGNRKRCSGCAAGRELSVKYENVGNDK